jgi:acetyl-CoA C-acetyltransferase
MSSVIGYYTTKYGEIWNKSLFDLVEEVMIGVLKTTHIEKEQIDAIFFGNMLAGVLENNLHASAKISEILGVHIPVFRVEAACASGGIAFHLAHQYLASHKDETVLVVGAEKMNDYPVETITDALMAASSGEEQEAGLTFPGLYALLANTYMETFHYTEENLAYVAFKNHYHGSLNEKAQYQKQILLETILKSPYVADPLKVLDCSPISDGASAVILSSSSSLIKKNKNTTRVLATEVATDTISLKNRKSLLELAATRIASEKAFSKTKLKRKNIKVAEIHDCFTIAELFAMEDLGFWKKGEAGKRIKELSTMLGSNSDLIVNTSGGLKAAGHPIGATGIKQIGEIYLQITNQAEKRQIKHCQYGLAHNVGGSGGTAVVTILGS